jgi:hypothetical protein
MAHYPYYPPQRPMYPQVPPPTGRRSSKGPWILVAVLAVVCVIGLAIFGVVITQSREQYHLSPAVPTTSEIACPPGPLNPRANPDCSFLYFMKSSGYGSLASPQEEIAHAHEACAIWDQSGKWAALHMIVSAYPRLSTSDAARVLGIGVGAYCPQNGGTPYSLPSAEVPFQHPGWRF